MNSSIYTDFCFVVFRTICGTPNYIAPEILFDTTNGHSFEVDIWSIGVILFVVSQPSPLPVLTIMSRQIHAARWEASIPDQRCKEYLQVSSNRSYI